MHGQSDKNKTKNASGIAAGIFLFVDKRNHSYIIYIDVIKIKEMLQ